MSRRVVTFLGTSVVVSIMIAGCNSILDNQPGVLTEEAGTEPPPTGTGEPPPVPIPKNGSDADTPVPPDAGSSGCPSGERLCHGVCVKNDDPLYGCGDPSCAPCAAKHGTAKCQAGKCVVTECDKGFSDCNQDSKDGCEVDLSLATSCGACNAACQPAAPVCAPNGQGFHCATGCTPIAPLLCGAECVDPMTSANHCGGCNVKCPDVDNALVSCATGQCTFDCKPGYHACAGKCIVETDPSACGPGCVACPAPANGVATCVNGTCGATCNPGTHLCNGACVADNDPAACGPNCVACPAPPGGVASCTNGVCGTTCNAGTHACNGACVPDTDPATCGAACTPCPAPPNATATCVAGACGLSCAAGFDNCNANPVDGCEIAITNDPLNCGGCGVSCNGGACNNGICGPAPDAGM